MSNYLQSTDGKWNTYVLTPCDDPTAPPPPPPPPPAATEPVVPAGAVVLDMLPNSVAWKMNHDLGTPGDSSGTTTYPFTAPDGTTVRLFDFTDTSGGGEIYHVNVLKDSSMYNSFCYETVESSPDWSNVACAEKDLEHVSSTGDYQDLATQLDGYSGTVDITANHGWTHTKIKADPSKRSPNVLHTTRIYTKDNGDGTITYAGIFLDGTYYPINQTVSAPGHDKWNPNVLNIQLQYDGKSSGSVETKVYMSTLRVFCWKA